MASKILAFSFHEERDADLIEWVDSLPPRTASSHIRAILREHMDRDDRVEKMVREIWEKVVRGEWVMHAVEISGVEDSRLYEETANNLKGLGA